MPPSTVLALTVKYPSSAFLRFASAVCVADWMARHASMSVATTKTNAQRPKLLPFLRRR